jgi:hypothetical protein
MQAFSPRTTWLGPISAMSTSQALRTQEIRAGVGTQQSRQNRGAASKEVFMKLPCHRLAAFTLMVFLAGTMSPSAQQDQGGSEQEQKIFCEVVPPVVREEFRVAFPKARISSCVKELEQGQVAYEVSSNDGSTGRDMTFHPDGRFIVIEETIAFGDLPDPVQKAVLKRYPRDQITLAEKLMRDGTVLYEFQVASGGKLDEIVFDPHGTEVKE